MRETVLSKRRRELKESLRQKALKRLKRAVELLYKEGAEEVYVFGSILRTSEFNERSDVDIAVKGIPEGRWSSTVNKLEDIFKEIPFDLLFFGDDLRPEVRERIKKEGKLWRL